MKHDHFTIKKVDDAGLVAHGGVHSVYATISSDAETTLASGSAGQFLDLVYIMAANQSDAAITLDVYSGSGGSPTLSIEIPANATAGVAPAAPIPMNEKGQSWYVYYADSDVTGSTVDVTGLIRPQQ